MIVKETETDTFWCPFVRQLATATESGKLPGRGEVTAMAGINRGMGSSSGEPAFMGHCIGKGCMAWRWGSERLTNINTGLTDTAWSDTHGYCGLAGKP